MWWTKNNNLSEEEKEVVSEIKYRITEKVYGQDVKNDPRRVELLTKIKGKVRTANGIKEVESDRKNVLKYLKETAAELHNKNENYYNGTDVPICLCEDEVLNPINKMQPHMKLVLSQGLRVNKNKKHVALFEEITNSINHKDKRVVKSIFSGFRAVGCHEKSDIWPDEVRESRIHEKNIADFFNAENIKLRDHPPTHNSDDTLKKIWLKVMDQVESGVVQRIKRKDITMPPAYGFGVKQPSDDDPGKIRHIMHQKLNNDYTWAVERMRLLGTMVIFELLRIITIPWGTEENARRFPMWQSRKGTAKAVKRETKRRKLAKNNNVSLRKARDVELDENNIPKFITYQQAGKCDNGSILTDPCIGYRDFKSAYYQFGNENKKHNIIGVWKSDNWGFERKGGKSDAEKRFEKNFNLDPEEKIQECFQLEDSEFRKEIENEVEPAFRQKQRRCGEYIFFESCVLNMGNSHSCYNFCRVSELMMEVCLSLLCIVCVIYIDDTVIVEPRGTLDSAIATFVMCCDILGLIVQDQKDAALTVTNALRVLGMDYSFDSEYRLLSVCVQKAKLLKLQDIASQIYIDISNKEIDMDSLGSWVGLAIHVAFSRRFRCGMELFRYLYGWVQEDSFKIKVKCKVEKQKLKKFIQGILILLNQQAPMIFKRGQFAFETVHIFTDAAGPNEEKGLGPSVGAMNFFPAGNIIAWQKQFSPNEFSNLTKEKIGIIFFECVAPLVNIVTLVKYCRDKVFRKFLCEHIDNTVAVFAYVNGQSATTFLIDIVIAATLVKAELECMSYYDYLISETNIGDAMTRTVTSANDSAERSRKFKRAMQIFKPKLVQPQIKIVYDILKGATGEWQRKLSSLEQKIKESVDYPVNDGILNVI